MSLDEARQVAERAETSAARALESEMRSYASLVRTMDLARDERRKARA